MLRFYFVVGLFALSLYAWGQYRGVGLFDDFASTTPQRGGTSHTTFHK